MSKWKTITRIFGFLCGSVAFALVVYCYYIYNLDEDVSFVEFHSYDTENDLFPVMSVCFRQTLSNTTLQKYGSDVNTSSYVQYLHGEYFSENMTNIDYDSISMNISDFLIGYSAMWKNGTLLKFDENGSASVSYTHLTLPTICSV